MHVIMDFSFVIVLAMIWHSLLGNRDPPSEYWTIPALFKLIMVLLHTFSMSESSASEWISVLGSVDFVFVFFKLNIHQFHIFKTDSHFVDVDTYQVKKKVERIQAMQSSRQVITPCEISALITDQRA